MNDLIDDVLARIAASIGPDDHAVLVRLVGEREALRAGLRATEDAASVGLVAAIVAHDARNALMPMFVAADAVLGRGDPAIAESARILADGCWRIAGMLRRVTRLGHRGRPTRVDVNAVAAELLPTLHALVRDRALLNTRLEHQLPAVLIDPADLERALLNLVANARDASAGDGPVIVATSVRDAWVVVEVVDHGAGMDDETRARATEPFFTTKPPGHGTGLGLASVARFARDAGGSLEIDSEPGQGTRVRVVLPAARA